MLKQAKSTNKHLRTAWQCWRRRLILGLLALGLALLGAGIAGETGLLSYWLAPRLEQALARRGVQARIEHVRAGLFSGLQLSDLTLRHGQSSATIAHVELDFAWARFWRTHRVSWLLAISDANLGLSPPLLAANSGPLQISGGAATAVLSAGSVYQLAATGRLYGISLRVSCDGALPPLSGRGSNANLGWSQQLQGSELLINLVDFLRSQQLNSQDAWLSVRVPDWETRRRAPIELGLQIPAVTWQGERWLCKATLAWRNKLLRASSLSIQTAEGAGVRGQASLELATGAVAAELVVTARPQQLCHWLAQPVPGWLQPLHFDQTLPNAVVQLQASLDDLSNWQAHGTLVVPALQTHGIALAAASSRFSLTRHMIKLTDLTATLAGTPREQLHGSAVLQFPGRRAQLTLAGELQPRALLAIWPTPPAWLETIVADLRWAKALPQFNIDLAMPDLRDPYNWHGTAVLQGEQLRIRSLPITRFRTDFSLVNRRLSADLSAALPANFGNNLTATLHHTPATGHSSLTATAEVLPKQLLTALALPVPAELKRVQFSQPATLQLNLPKQILPSSNWHGDFTVELSGVSVEALTLEHLRLTGTIQPALVTVTVAEALASGGDLFSGSIELSRPFQGLGIKGQLHGDPRLLRYVIPSGSRRVYDQVWRRFSWPSDHPPTITLERFQVGRWLDRNGNSDLQLDAVFTAGPVSYYKLDADKLNARVQVRLPASIVISDIILQQGEDTARGDIQMTLGSNARYRLKFAGTFDPWAAIGGFAPELGSWPQRCQFANGTQLELEGGGRLGSGATLALTGKLQTAQLRIDDLELANLACRWRWDNHTFTWADLTAELYDGALHTEGRFDSRRQVGDIQIAATDVRLQGLMASIATENPPRDQGRLRLDCAVAISRPGTPRQLQLDGRGSLQVSDADLWQLPFFHRLADVLRFSVFEKLSTLGSISKLDAELVFAGDRVEVPAFNTDGTLVSLRGKGMYGLTGRRLAFLVEGVALQNLPFIPQTISPLSWLFGAELQGSVAEPKWKLASGVRRLLSGKDDNLSFDSADR